MIEDSQLNTRAIAAQLLAPVLNDCGHFSGKYKNADLSKENVGFIRLMCYGTLRMMPRLNLILDQLLIKPIDARNPEIKALLLIGIFQLYYLKYPGYAVTSASVSACIHLGKPWAKALTNAVLRNAIRRREEITKTLESSPQYQYAHPQWMIDAWQKSWRNESESIFEANNRQPPMIMRCIDREQTVKQLEAADIDYHIAENCATALTLGKALPVEAVPGFTQGLVSVQDESAQWAAPLLQLEPNQSLLDACAAPGGKTLHCLQMEPSIQVVALDISKSRLIQIEENITRANLDLSKVQLLHTDIINYQLDSQLSQEQGFDRILLDAPCSATGVIRRHPDIKTLRRPSDIQQFANQQWQLLTHCWSMLKPGGILLYCTCSIMPEENRELITKFIQQFPQCSELPIESNCGIAQNFGRQILPHIYAGDGFYYARLQKTDVSH